jgi:hypothetical protein
VTPIRPGQGFNPFPLLPGDRVCVVDWRLVQEGRSGEDATVDGTLFGYYLERAARRELPGPVGRLVEATRLLGGTPSNADWRDAAAGVLHGRLPRSYGGASFHLCVQRDCFVGTRSFSSRELVAVLDGGGPRGRFKRLATAVESLACFRAVPVKSFLYGKTFTPRGCPGCLAFCEDQDIVDREHFPRECPGAVLIPELAALLEELGTTAVVPTGG